jgi:hypothetical protein
MKPQENQRQKMSASVYSLLPGERRVGFREDCIEQLNTVQDFTALGRIAP